MADTCNTCRFWARRYSGVGMCRRFPPVSLPSLAGTWPGDSTRTVFPQTAANDWCGEHQHKGEGHG